ncbi:hypothetical protein B296_00006607 [Ensete ventricosum]|uniref:Uncharacterized protein n=1 Tax=Ensete ventricosum TaxID=4639 RepID=A0A427AGP8_ENSVE|nr:hypothetical protein B296_00006607 [Ensete ventricosum]
MQWDLAGSSLANSPKESRSSLGSQREIVGKKIGGLTVRLSEYAGNPGGGQHFRRVNCPSRRVNRPYPAMVLKPIWGL